MRHLVTSSPLSLVYVLRLVLRTSASGIFGIAYLPNIKNEHEIESNWRSGKRPPHPLPQVSEILQIGYSKEGLERK